MEIDQEIFSTDHQPQERLLSVTSEIMYTGYWLTASPKLVREKNVVRFTGRLDMTIAVDWNFKS